MKKLFLLSLSCLLLLLSCKSPLFTSRATSPHARYAENLQKASLDNSAMGRAWLNAAAKSLAQPLTITLPYQETGYFDAVKTSAAGYQFSLRRGENIQISVTKKPAVGFDLFMELWRLNEGNQPTLEKAATPDHLQLSMEIEKGGNYLLRLQPELLGSGEYTLMIQIGPSLAFPVQEKVNPKIGSFWGDRRDRGERTHEGIDIFAPRRTPVIAGASGTIVSVSMNTLGGKVIFLRAADRGYSLYYAHLDSQMVTQGQRVQQGEIVGLLGNSGNAKSTAPHLHFGIYTNEGPVDPLPFVERKNSVPPSITIPVQRLNEEVRNNADAKIYSVLGKNPVSISTLKANTLLKVKAATSSFYKVSLPDESEGFIAGSAITSVEKGIQTITINQRTPLWDGPNINAAAKSFLNAGDKAILLAKFNDFSYVKVSDLNGWIRN